MPSRHNARFSILQIAYTDLMNVAHRSPFIQVTPLDPVEGWPAEEYLVNYTCKGIARVSADGSPVFSDHHEMKLRLSAHYPANEPSLLWLTDIWHPNIGHQTRHVCTNAIATWYPQKSLVDLLVSIGEMIQYKHYFAGSEAPYPEDPDVAKWVREVAEPNGWIGPQKPVDDRPMLREQRIRKAGPGAEEGPRIDSGGARLGNPSRQRIRLGVPSPPERMPD